MLDISTSMEKTQFDANKHIHKIVQSKARFIPEKSMDNLDIWSADSYFLNQSDLFNEINVEKQKNILDQLAFLRLQEAYHVEHYGMCFASKMSLLANSLEEQQLYCEISAEEADHLVMIKQLLGSYASHVKMNEFSHFLKDVIAYGEKAPLVFIIQILLEGWGLDHYRILGETSNDPQVKDVFQLILKDESAHHGSGLVMFNEKDLSSKQMKQILEVMQAFLSMIRVGPTTVTDVFSVELDGLKQNTKEKFLVQIKAEDEIRRKLNLVKKLIEHAKAYKILEQLNFN